MTWKFSYYLLFSVAFLSPIVSEARNYHIYGERLKGSKFRERLYSWPVALRKGYDQLSDKQKAIVNKDYPELTQGDRPPYPARGVYQIIEPYVSEFRYFGVGAGGELKIRVNAKGVVTHVSASPHTHSDIERFISRLVREIEFEPATCGGESCAMDFVLVLKQIDNPRYERNF